MVDFSALQAKLDALAAEATATEGVEASAVVVIKGFAEAIKAAIVADDKLDQAATDAAVANVDAVTARFVAARTPLGEAIAA